MGWLEPNLTFIPSPDEFDEFFYSLEREIAKAEFELSHHRESYTCRCGGTVEQISLDTHECNRCHQLTQHQPQQQQIGQQQNQVELFLRALRHPQIAVAGTWALAALQGVGSLGLGGLIGAWIQARTGRKVRLKVGDLEAEAHTMEEVEKLLVRAQEIQQQNQPKKVIP